MALRLRRPSSGRIWQVGLAAAAVALCAVSVFLEIENAQYRDELRNYSSAVPFIVPEGALAPAIRGRTESGHEVDVVFSGSGPQTLFIVFNGACHFCQDNWQFWRQLSETATSRGENIVFAVPVGGGSQNATVAYLRAALGKRAGAHVTYLSELSPEVIAGFELHYVPDTILVGGNGRVLQAYTGVLTSEEFRKIAGLL